MYNRVKKRIGVCILLALAGCRGGPQMPAEAEIRRQSQAVIPADTAAQIYRQACDSLRNWVDHRLKQYFDCRLNTWGLDSLLCFNRAGDKCMTVLWTQSTYNPDASSDDINYFNGVRIKGRWYFFRGPNIVLPRKMFGADTSKPMSPVKLHEISLKLYYRNYLQQAPGSQDWTINERFFSDLTSVAWCTDCTTPQQWDAAYLRQVALNWQLKDTLPDPPR